MSVLVSSAQAESFTAEQKRSFVDAPNSKFISSCVDAIEDYHDRDARLFLNQRGSLSRINGMRSFQIHGWIWKDGARARATHDCAVHDGGEGLLVRVSYPEATEVADRKGKDSTAG